MKNILVPTDFSENSMRALQYAQELANYLDGSIKVVNIAHPTIDPVHPYITPPIDDFADERKVQLQNFVSDAVSSDSSNVIPAEKISHDVILGFAAEEIVNLSSSEEVNIIVMGTTGSGGVLDRIFGSVSSLVAQKAHCPILLVPNGVSFSEYENILYASSYTSSNNVLLEQITDFASTFKANIHLVHVEAHPMEKENLELEELILNQMLKEKNPCCDIKFVTLESKNTWKGIQNYAEKNTVDLIVVVHPHRNFLERITHKSFTKEVVFGAHRPILVLPIEV